MVDPNWQSLLSALLGGLGVTGIAKYFIKRSAEKLDEIPDQLAEIKAEIRVLIVRLETLAELKSQVHEHDRKIIALEHRKADAGATKMRSFPNGRDT